jgi:hypothetical protein
VSIFSCKDNVRLISESLDRDLTIGQRLELHTHLLVCPMCSNFRRQMLFLHRSAGEFENNDPGRDGDGQAPLSPEARERIQRALEEGNPPDEHI